MAGGIVILARLRLAALPIVAWLPASLLLLAGPYAAARQAHRDSDPASRPAGRGRRLASRSLTLRQTVAVPLPAALVQLARAGIALVVVGLAAYLVFAPAVLARDADLMYDPDPLENDPPSYWYPEVSATLRAITDQHEMIVTDHPYLTFRADRLVPPPLVESSVTRIVAGSLTPDDSIAEATRYDAKAVLLWADKLTTMREVKAWIDKNLVPVRAYGADGEAIPTLYVRPDHVARATAALATLTPRAVAADFEGGIHLRRFGLDRDRLSPGDVSAVNVELVATGKPAASYRAVFQLRGDDGSELWKSDELAIGGLGPGSASWSDGRTMSLSALIRLPRSAKPGEYSLSMRLYDPRARRFVDSTLPGVEPAGPIRRASR